MPNVLTSEDATKLLDACRDDWVGKRNRAMLALGYRAGLRCGEVLELRPESVRGRSLWVQTLKGGPARELGLDPKTLEILKAWTDVRLAGNEWLFHSRNGLQIRSQKVRFMVAQMARRAGLRQRVHFHLLRHTFARQLYDEGVGMREIQLALGHSRLETTAHYLVSIGATEVVAITQRREW